MVPTISTDGTGISHAERNAIKKAMLRYDAQDRIYIEFYGEKGLITLTREKFFKQEDARFWIAIHFPLLLGDIT